MEPVVTGGEGVAWYDPPADPMVAWTTHTIDPSFGTANMDRPFAADFDGDGPVDVAVSSSLDAELRWYRNDGSDALTGPTVEAAYPGISYLTGGDIDGDGRPDLVTSTYNHDLESTTDRIAWWRN